MPPPPLVPIIAPTIPSQGPSSGGDVLGLNSNGHLSPFAGLRTPTEIVPKKPMTLITRGCFLWVADHIILGTPGDNGNHYHLLTTTRADPRRTNDTAPPDTFYIIDGDQLLTYKKSETPYRPDPQHFKWKTMANFSNIGTLTVVIIDK